MKLLAAAAVVVAFVMLADPARADPAASPVNIAQMTLGYTYYNRPGANLKAHDADIAECLTAVIDVRSMDELMSRPGTFAGGIAASVVDSLFDSEVRRATTGGALENCMVVRGWRVVRLPDPEGQALAALRQEELAARLEPSIGAEAPQGEIVRVWGNDGAKPANIRTLRRPKSTKDGQLSLKAVSPQMLAEIKAKPVPLAPVPNYLGRVHSLKPAQIASAPAGTAIVMVRLTGTGGKTDFSKGSDLTFTRDDSRDVLLITGSGRSKKKLEGDWYVLPVTPGRWRLSEMYLVPALTFCLGAPSFEVKAGEVVYLGTFDLGAPTLSPDLSLESPKAYLAGQPAANALRPAAYVNGSTVPCDGSVVYALEFEGAPFKPGYVWGGAAGSATQAGRP